MNCLLSRAFRALALSGFVVFSLSACDTVRGVIDVKGSQYTQEGLQTAEDTICRYAPVGGVIRRYNTAEKAGAWVRLCLTSTPDGRPLVDAITSEENTQ